MGQIMRLCALMLRESENKARLSSEAATQKSRRRQWQVKDTSFPSNIG
jgi:hypothetical protein